MNFNHPLHNIKSSVNGIAWPPIAGAKVAPLLALMHQFRDTQWMPAEMISANQFRQLSLLAAFAEKHSVCFRERLRAAGLKPVDLSTPEGFRTLPLLGRRELQSAGDDLFCSKLPQSHAPYRVHQTSGSSGEPVTIRRTVINNLFYMATNLREFLWHQRDPRGTLAVLRANIPKGVSNADNWGEPFTWLFDTGPVFLKSIATDVDEQVRWLKEVNPDYLLTYPTNLAALARRFEHQGTRLPRLRQVRSIGENLTDDIRDDFRRVLNVEIVDTYSSEEMGTIAIQCPVSGHYHVMAESLIVEVLDDDGNPCRPGETGRVVLTDLHNFATPLIRYDIRDYAQVGAPCRCGRGLPVITQILGRQRNMLLLPDGRRHWPLVGFHHFRAIAPIRQYQVIQRDRETMEVRLVPDVPLTQDQENRLGEVIRTALGYPFCLNFVYFATEIPRTPRGKFEEFICEAV